MDVLAADHQCAGLLSALPVEDDGDGRGLARGTWTDCFQGSVTGEQYVAETGRSTPTVQDVPHSGQLDVTLAFTASVLARARRIRRQCRERQADEQNIAVAFAVGISGPPHPRHSRGLESFFATATSRSRENPSLPMRPTYEAKTAADTHGADDRSSPATGSILMLR
ncbi:hypothetical protein OHA79_46805 (plasmid) [Streptomyces sp. NBC_00841]|uniref:hypothetical protein n=1 Tax=unclassified Streptomyces TaxID=2593676 RepID=UPI00225C0B9B|nr:MULTISPECIES: hypothetical protein [unclassified Streptomyces]MCX4537944.1 hypothetical protein [Streptomyces sp. NBC_01669]WSA05124.1 hypothetical protein OHA79_46805 [Streptomyces sp. NBC_00841]